MGNNKVIELNQVVRNDTTDIDIKGKVPANKEQQSYNVNKNLKNHGMAEVVNITSRSTNRRYVLTR